MMCPRCKRRPRNPHWNAKWCGRCAAELRRCPAGKLTPAQERKVRRLAGTIFIHELAKEVGTSKPNLTRWSRQSGVDLNALRYPDAIVREICEFYAKNGKQKTQRRYPKVKVRSVIERYFKGLGLEPRQIRWTPAQLIKLAQMAGLVSYERQAIYFKRPNAHVGSIRSAWMKIFKSAGGSINGLSRHIAREYVTNACPFYETDYWVTERGEFSQRRSLALWVDVAAHLRPDVPDHLASAIQTMARFQGWLHGKDPRQSILRILQGDL